MEEFEQNQSVFNSTLAILIRIDRLWQDAHRHSRAGQLEKWNWDLDRVWLELIPTAIKSKKQEDITKFEEINQEVKAAWKNKADLYNALYKKEVFLRTIEDKQGKGVKYEDTIDEMDF